MITLLLIILAVLLAIVLIEVFGTIADILFAGFSIKMLWNIGDWLKHRK